MAIYFIDQGDRMLRFVDGRQAGPAVPKHEFKTVDIVGNNDAIRVLLEASGQKAEGGMDFTFKYADVDVAAIEANGGAVADGYPAITDIDSMVDWLLSAIWTGPGAGAGGASGAIDSFEIQSDDYHTLRLVDGDATEFDVDLMKAGYREIAFTSATTVGPITLASGVPPPVIVALTAIGAGAYEYHDVTAAINASNQLLISWIGARTGKIILK